MAKQLYRSRRDRVVAGVAGGLGEYLAVDPVLIRLAWAALFFLGGSGLLLYILAWIVIPEEPETEAKHTSDNEASSLPAQTAYPTSASVESDNPAGIEGSQFSQRWSSRDDGHTVERRRRIVGGILIVLGLVFFANEFAPRWVNTDLLWPLCLIALGIFILGRRDKGER